MAEIAESKNGTTSIPASETVQVADPLQHIGKTGPLRIQPMAQALPVPIQWLFQVLTFMWVDVMSSGVQ